MTIWRWFLRKVLRRRANPLMLGGAPRISMSIEELRKDETLDQNVINKLFGAPKELAETKEEAGA